MTELSFVLVFVIKSFDSVMCSSALIFLWALFSFSEFTQFRGIVIVISALVLNGVVVVATLMVVWRVLPWTLDPLEIVKAQMLYYYGLLCSVMHLI